MGFNYDCENTNRRDNRLIPKLLKVVKESQPDLIHVHGTEECFGLIQSFCKIPIVISLQGILSPYTEKFFSGIPQSIAIKKYRFNCSCKCPFYMGKSTEGQNPCTGKHGGTERIDCSFKISGNRKCGRAVTCSCCPHTGTLWS